MNRRGRPPYPDVLTPRQQEVLELLRQGFSNTEIATQLGISPDGAKFHVSEIFSRLGVTSREEAARWHREESDARPNAMLRRGLGSLRLRRDFPKCRYHRRRVVTA